MASPINDAAAYIDKLPQIPGKSDVEKFAKELDDPKSIAGQIFMKMGDSLLPGKKIYDLQPKSLKKLESFLKVADHSKINTIHKALEITQELLKMNIPSPAVLELIARAKDAIAPARDTRDLFDEFDKIRGFTGTIGDKEVSSQKEISQESEVSAAAEKPSEEAEKEKPPLSRESSFEVDYLLNDVSGNDDQ